MTMTVIVIGVAVALDVVVVVMVNGVAVVVVAAVVAVAVAFVVAGFLSEHVALLYDQLPVYPKPKAAYSLRCMQIDGCCTCPASACQQKHSSVPESGWSNTTLIPELAKPCST